MKELARTQREDIYERGYTVLPAVVPRPRVDAALRAINMSVGDNGLDPDELPIFRMDSFCPELERSEAILDLLYETPLWDVAQAAIGHGKVLPIRSGQIALRFPSDDSTPAVPHIDGLYTAPFRVASGRGPVRPLPGEPRDDATPKVRNFTALAGVYLSDVPRADSGNLTVWPGSHRRYEMHFRQHGPASLYEGMPRVALEPAVQLTAQAGDAVLCHYQLGHGIAPNLSPYIRYAVYFRLYREGHEEVVWRCMADIWCEWDGVAP